MYVRIAFNHKDATTIVISAVFYYHDTNNALCMIKKHVPRTFDIHMQNTGTLIDIHIHISTSTPMFEQLQIYVQSTLS